MLEKRKKLEKNFVLIFLILFGVYIIGRFLKIFPVSVPRKNPSTVQAAEATLIGSSDIHIQRKQTTSIVIGRLGYALFNDGTATVTDEAGAAMGLKSKTVDITIPASIFYQGKKYTVTVIGQKCFFDREDGKQNYGKIVLPDTIKTIGMGAFYKVSCEELVIPDSVTTVEEYAFCGMSVKKDFYYPAGATEIPRGALLGMVVENGCLVIPETITRLYYWAIGTSSPVRLLCEPDGIDPFAIFRLSGEIEIGGKNGFVVENGMLLNKDKTELIKCVKATSMKIVVPDTVRRIHPFAFCYTDVQDLQKEAEERVRIYLPEGLTELEVGTFYGNEWIDRVFLPASLKKIGEGVFVTNYPENTQITVVFQSEQVPEIGENNEVKEVDVPDAFLKKYRDVLERRLQYEKIY